jgi:hypothetical protein
MDANSVLRKLVLIVPATCTYTEGLKFPVAATKSELAAAQAIA